MSRKQIIQMARDAGLEEMWELTPSFIGRLERFATAIRAATKEEDARICEELANSFGGLGGMPEVSDDEFKSTWIEAAAAIRASK